MFRTTFVILYSLGFILLHAENGVMTLDEIGDLYTEIREMSLDSTRILLIESLSLSRDVAEFELKHGYLYFFEPVNDRIVAAFYEGEGIFILKTDDSIEKQQIERFTDAESVEKPFERALFLFTDSTYEYIVKKQQTLATQPIGDSVNEFMCDFRRRIRERFLWNIDARILSDLATIGYGQYFSVILECQDSDRLVFLIDPLDREEVTLLRYEKIKFSKRACFECWYSSHTSKQLMHDKPQFDITKVNLDVTIDTRQKMTVTAKTEFVPLVDDIVITPVELVSFLRVNAAWLDGEDTCLIIQEDKSADAQLWLAFPKALKAGQAYELMLVYSGEGIIEGLGGDNFAVMARTSWFPSFYTNKSDPRRFIMEFAIPGKMTLLATGRLLRSWNEGDTAFSVWESEIDYNFAGFNYGKFAMVSEKSEKCEIKCFTNIKLNDDLLQLKLLLERDKDLQAALMLMPNELTTDRMGKSAAVESRNACEIYRHFFGNCPFREIKVSQQPQISFAQSWPTLIYLPYTAFWDESLKERLGLLRGEVSVMSYETIASHEIAHQWWGNTLMRDSYHDQWLTEGFATYSSALYLQASEGVDRFKDFMRIQRQQVLAKAEKGGNYNDLGPIWLGMRLSSLDFPGGDRLVYAKGAYVLHMLRMMLFDYKKKSDERFIAMMKDYVQTYAARLVSTNDFQRIVEKHFNMDMEWFFDQWVYSTDVPFYKFEYDVEESDGEYYLTIYAQQAGVSPSFEMPMPFVVNFERGHAVVQMQVKGLEAVAKKFHLPQEPVSIEPNPWNAVLCTIVN